MKKTFNFIFSILALVYIVIMAIAGLNTTVFAQQPILLDFFKGDAFKFISTWAPFAILFGFAFTNFFAKSLKILLLILLIACAVLYVLTIGFPQIFA